MYSANVIALGLVAFKGTETEQRIVVLLYDDNFQVISTFELNQMASLTYHEGSLVGEYDITEKILEHLVTILSKPIDYTPLSVEKALVVTKHLLIFGASKVIQSIKMELGRYIEPLQQYNTALLAQQQTGATGMIMRLKGGSVDKGGPVRELAVIVYSFLLNDNTLQFERNAQADPNSLVPIGDRKQVGFVSDDARLRYLKKKMEHHKMMEQRSNLAKASDGFGSGYNSRDGKAVVGAAHGIDEMIKQAQREKQRFSDEKGTYRGPNIDVDELKQYAQEFEQQYGYSSTTNNQQQQQQQQQQQPVVDLLAFDSTPSTYNSSDLLQPQHYQQQHQQVDLLDLGSGGGGGNHAVGNHATNDLFNADLFGGDPYTAPSPDVGRVSNTADLLSVMSLTSSSSTTTMPTQPQPYSTMNTTTNTAMSSIVDPFAISSTPVQSQQPNMNHPMVMSNRDDRFAALDDLIQPTTNVAGSTSTTTSFMATTGSMTSTNNNAFSGLGNIPSMTGTGFNNSNNHHNHNNNNLGSGYGLSSGYNSSSMSSTTFTPTTSTTMGGGNGMGHLSYPPPLPTISDPTSIQISQLHTPGLNNNNNNDDDDVASGFVMGGTVGTGLEPMGSAPAAPPPPPPPPGSLW